MNKTDWQRRSALFDEVVDLPAADRDSWLTSLAAREPDHVEAVKKMLAHYDRDVDRANRTTAPSPPTLGMAGVHAHDFVAKLDAATSEDGGANLQLQSGEEIGAWQLERKIGEGGMGAVWLAKRRDGHFEGRSAIKFLRAGLGKTEVVERFLRERRLLARLTHPGIARLLDAGTYKGEPYLVMEFIDGQPITAWAAEHALRVVDRVALILKVCHATEHAHGQLIVHRDLKPSNVLVSSKGEPSLLDFGIAKLIDDDSDDYGTALTRMTGRGYTLGYCAPEQITGEPTGVAADVFSIGVLMFELLTGAMPYKPEREGRAALEHAIVHTDARSVSKVLDEPVSDAKRRPVDAARARGDLEAIVAKALRAQPADRYTTVSALADDLDRWMNSLPVLARRSKWQYTTLLWLKRNRALAAVTAAAFIAVGTGMVASLWQADRASDEARRADLEKETAIEQRRRAEAATSQATAALADANAQKIRASAEALRADQEAADAKRALQIAARNELRANQAAEASAQSLSRANAAAKRTESAKQFLAGMFDSRRFERYEPGKRGEFPVKELITQSAQDLRNAKMDPDLKAELLGEASGLFRNIDEEAAAITAAQDALALAKPLRNSSPSVYRNAVLALVFAPFNATQNAEAMPLLLEVIADMEHEKLTETSLYADAIMQRGEATYGSKGPASEGRNDMRSAAGIFEKLGRRTDQAYALSRWAIMTDLAGDSAAALPEFARAINLYKAAGESGAKLAQLQLRYASALRRAERIEEAFANFESAIAINERVLGKGHSRTLDAKLAFGFVLVNYGEPARGIAMVNDAYEQSKAQGFPPATVFRASSTLARAMVGEGDPAKIMQLASESRDFYRTNKRAVGEVSNLETMAQAALFSENFADAVRLADEADETADRAYGKSGVQRDVTRVAKAFVLTAANHANALSFIDQTMKGLTATRGVSSNRVLLQCYRAQVLVSLGRLSEAAVEIETVRAEAEADGLRLAATFYMVEIELVRARRPAGDVVAILRKLLQARIKGNGAGSFQSQMVRLELATELARQNRQADAERVLADVPAAFDVAMVPPIKQGKLAEGITLLLSGRAARG